MHFRSLLLSTVAIAILLIGCKTVEIRTNPTKAEVYQEGSTYTYGSTPYKVQNVSSPRTYELKKSGNVPKYIKMTPESPDIVEVALDKQVAGKTLVEVVEGETGQIEVRRTAVHAEREVIERSPNVTAVRRLTDLPENRFVQEFCLSPAGETLVMAILDEETIVGGDRRNYSNLWAIDATAGGGMRRVTQGKYFDRTPCYTPDGKAIYFAANRAGKFNIWRLSITTLGGLGLVTSAGTSDLYPAVSPSGDEILYTAEMPGVVQKQLWSMPVNRGLPRQLREGTEGRWSPNGTKILFSEGDRTIGKMKIWTMNPDGSSPTQLTSAPDYDDLNPGWSPDGSRIIFASDRGLAQDQHNFDIWIMNHDGSDPKQLTTNGSRDDHPVFSPDGKTIYFRSNRGLKWDIWVMELADSKGN